jgi:acetoin utilization deacetylase AcuC-like enzyme
MLDVLEAVRGRSTQLDADTAVSPDSVDIAERSAGAGLTAVEALRAGVGDAAFCAVRPPGHHATLDRPMGFCLLNTVAVTAAALVAEGERVLIADFDAHHGNGTQDIFYDDPDVLFVSWHQSPLYPGTGGATEIGGPRATGRTVNIPVAAGTTGDAYLSTFDEVLAPIVTAFDPTWLLISAGFDGHRADPITDLGLSSGDFADLTTLLMQVVPPGRTVAFLEGGYDLGALERSATATMDALVGRPSHPEAPSSGSRDTAAWRRTVDSVRHAQGLV